MKPGDVCVIHSEEWRSDKVWAKHFHENSFYRGRVVEIWHRGRRKLLKRQVVYTIDGDYTMREYHMAEDDFYTQQNDYNKQIVAGTPVRLMVCDGAKDVKTVANVIIQLFPDHARQPEGSGSEGPDAEADSGSEAAGARRGGPDDT